MSRTLRYVPLQWWTGRVGTSRPRRRATTCFGTFPSCLSVGQPGAAQQIAGPGGGFEIYILRAALPGVNGAALTSASDIAQMITQALSQTAPDLRITLAPNHQQLILVGSPYSIKVAKGLIDQLDVAQKLVVLDAEVLEVDENVAKNLGLQITTPVVGSTFSEVSPRRTSTETLNA